MKGLLVVLLARKTQVFRNIHKCFEVLLDAIHLVRGRRKLPVRVLKNPRVEMLRDVLQLGEESCQNV